MKFHLVVEITLAASLALDSQTNVNAFFYNAYQSPFIFDNWFPVRDVRFFGPLYSQPIGFKSGQVYEGGGGRGGEEEEDYNELDDFEVPVHEEVPVPPTIPENDCEFVTDEGVDLHTHLTGDGTCKLPWTTNQIPFCCATEFFHNRPFCKYIRDTGKIPEHHHHHHHPLPHGHKPHPGPHGPHCGVQHYTPVHIGAVIG